MSPLELVRLDARVIAMLLAAAADDERDDDDERMAFIDDLWDDLGAPVG